MGRIVNRILLSVLTVLLLADTGHARDLNPTTYYSPSGKYSLFVDPSERDGRGVGNYRLTRDGVTVWEKQLPFTFWEAVVADSGHIAGYVYTYGWEGSSGTPEDRSYGEFLTLILNADGEVVFQRREPREHSRYLHDFPNPLANGLFLSSTTEEVVIRIRNPDSWLGDETWRILNYRTGEQIGSINPLAQLSAMGDQEQFSILGAKAIPGIPLVLVHLSVSNIGKQGEKDPVYSGRFMLIEMSGKPHWRLDRAGEFETDGNGKSDTRLLYRILDGGGIINVNASPGFTILFTEERQQVSFSVTENSTGSWDVRETGRVPDQQSTPPSQKELPADVQPESLPLEQIAVVPLRSNSDPDVVIRDIKGFNFDADGNICVLCGRSQLHLSAILLSPSGSILKRMALPSLENIRYPKYPSPACIGQRKFIALVSDANNHGRTHALVLDFGQGQVTQLKDFDCPTAIAIAGFEDGQFIALTNQRQDRTISRGLFCFDSDGVCLWKKVQEKYRGAAEELLVPVDLAAVKDGFAVLDSERDGIQFFDRQGQFVKSIELKQVWNRDFCHPTRFAARGESGFAVYDESSARPVVLIDSKGQIQSQVAPRFLNQKQLASRSGLKCSPDGAAWIGNKDVIAKLSADGVVEQSIGEILNKGVWGTPDSICVDANGRIFIEDQRTQIGHIFNSSGTRIGSCQPEEMDLTSPSRFGQISVSPRGEVFIHLIDTDKTFVHFDSQLNRLGKFEFDANVNFRDASFLPFGRDSWVVGTEEILLVRDLKDVLKTIKQDAHRRWLSCIVHASMAADGTLAAWNSNVPPDEDEVIIISPEGELLRTFPIENLANAFYSQLSFDGRLILVAGDDEVLVYRTDGTLSGRFQLPDELDPSNNLFSPHRVGPFIASEGKEIWFIDRKVPAIHRFRMPTVADPE
ncbi:NHL repeat-containing protein [Planctomicrobium piriforme]|uniref:NHL repeat-containing protein n=1 Tax=Planctomicrobium piriforme TaxID=1576369 RepID=A0A1I3MMJ5_9PLAN|nr:hypothetical protein [Planctomicrobium piriforme]SFI98217.1 hypothetical protein SAMN05421753_11452 [Planctomicrobium piriforme]